MSLDDLSDRELVSCELVRVVPDVSDVVVSPSSVVTEMCEVPFFLQTTSTFCSKSRKR